MSMRLLLFAVAVAVLTTPVDARACTEPLAPERVMSPADGTIVPLNVRFVIWSFPRRHAEPARVTLVRLTDGEPEAHGIATAITQPRSPFGFGARPVERLQPYSEYEVRLAYGSDRPRALGRFYTANDIDTMPPVWNGISISSLEKWIYLRWPGVIVDRTTLRDTTFGVWCADQPFHSRRRLAMLLTGDFLRIRGIDSVCPSAGSGVPLWVAPIDVAGNVGRPAWFLANRNDVTYRQEREINLSRDARFDATTTCWAENESWPCWQQPELEVLPAYPSVVRGSLRWLAAILVLAAAFALLRTRREACATV
jgi:hypothetical protein